jgi:benzodiazapine receptor
MKFKPLALIINIAIPLTIGAIGSFFTAHSVKTWYPTLAKPAFNPPDWLFAPVWTTLYILIGISAYLVWQKRKEIVHFPRTIAIYLMQLTLNLMWSFIFFYARQVGVALVEIVLLLIIVIINAGVFYKTDKTAGLLFVPYILWVGFATLLTAGIFSLN